MGPLGLRRPSAVGRPAPDHGPSAEVEIIVDISPRPAVGLPPIGLDRSNQSPPFSPTPVDDDLDVPVAREQALHVRVQRRLVPSHDHQGILGLLQSGSHACLGAPSPRSALAAGGGGSSGRHRESRRVEASGIDHPVRLETPPGGADNPGH